MDDVEAGRQVDEGVKGGRQVDDVEAGRQVDEGVKGGRQAGG